MKKKISEKQIRGLVEERKLHDVLNLFGPIRTKKLQQDYKYLGIGNAAVIAGNLKSELEALESNYSKGYIEKVKFDEEFEQISQQIILLADKISKIN